MASATPAATPEVIDLVTVASPYNSRSLTITVEGGKIPFVIHEAILAKTSFFEAHALRQEEAAVEQQEFSNDGVVEVKGEDGAIRRVRVVETDFHVKDCFFATPAAFEIFVKFLYNQNPTAPTTLKQLRTLQRAYGLATRYNCYTLQNTIIDCIRSYHAQTQVKLDELIWTCNRFGDSTGCPLNAYLVNQIAYEIAYGGYARFLAHNPFMKVFMEEGNRRIRGALFQAIVNHTNPNQAADPSTGKNRYHVHEQGADVGRLK